MLDKMDKAIIEGDTEEITKEDIKKIKSSRIQLSMKVMSQILDKNWELGETFEDLYMAYEVSKATKFVSIIKRMYSDIPMKYKQGGEKEKIAKELKDKIEEAEGIISLIIDNRKSRGEIYNSSQEYTKNVREFKKLAFEIKIRITEIMEYAGIYLAEQKRHNPFNSKEYFPGLLG